MNRIIRLRRLAAPVLFAGTLAASLFGCSNSPAKTWQREVERYIAEVGNGDPGSLLAGATEDGRFDLVGPSPAFSGSGEINAVMLGPVRGGGRVWQAMVVGDVRRSDRSESDPIGRATLAELSLALLRVERGRVVWTWSEDADDAARAYASGLGDDAGFPQPGDRWSVRVEDGDEVIATDARSGVTLEVELDD